MFPATLSSVLLFLAILGPGYLYFRRVEKSEARYKSSAFRETASIVVSSVLFLALALSVFSAVRISLPAVTPDVGAIVREPNAYVTQNYQLVMAWAVATFLLSLLLAYALGLSQSKHLIL